MKRILVAASCVALSFPCSGCRASMPVLERSKGKIEYGRTDVVQAAEFPVVKVSPATASQSKDGVDVTVRYASPEELNKFFEDKKVFGNLAGKNPYPEGTLVFYVKVANYSGKKIQVNPEYFVMIDNLNIQYSELSADNISALYESKSGLWSFARTTGDLAPGYYGAPLKIAGTMGAGSGRKQHYMIKQVRLAVGYIFPGIAYDGYVAFPRSHPNATSVRLLIHNLKTDFNANDEPANTYTFEFPFSVEQEPAKPAVPSKP